MTDATLVEPGAIGDGEAVIVDCRFDLARPAAGREAWLAGHIPGAENRFWGDATDDSGRLLDDAALASHWGELLEAEQLVAYCGSGVSACINLFTLARLGRGDAQLYAGSWSDWCSYLPADG
jgi:thiosulfate/3-mercaptopyruvate sulfurtransferase